MTTLRAKAGLSTCIDRGSCSGPNGENADGPALAGNLAFDPAITRRVDNDPGMRVPTTSSIHEGRDTERPMARPSVGDHKAFACR